MQLKQSPKFVSKLIVLASIRDPPPNNQREATVAPRPLFACHSTLSPTKLGHSCVQAGIMVTLKKSELTLKKFISERVFAKKMAGHPDLPVLGSAGASFLKFTDCCFRSYFFSHKLLAWFVFLFDITHRRSDSVQLLHCAFNA
jgi:hypothetical protein